MEDRELGDLLEFLTFECPTLYYPANQLHATLHCPANQPDPPAITHRWRGPPSLKERGLFFVALLCQSIVRFVAVSCQSAGPASYHPPLTRSPLFQRKRALVRCITHCFLSIELTHELVLPQASFHVEGGGPRERWRMENSLAC